MSARIAATSLALLPLLAAGHTHGSGEYREQVRSGVEFLVGAATSTPGGSSLSESGGTMYSHALGTLVLCELYAMTHDPQYKAPAQAAVDFICYAQDPVGGGWRYMPRQPGDTSVTGWQLSALAAAQLAELDVPAATLAGADRFLDSVAMESGAFYGYSTPDKRLTTTAFGLLGRQHLGWERKRPAMTQGVTLLSSEEPSAGDCYFNYYCANVLRNHGNRPWKQWNRRFRGYLIDSQEQQGHEAGSWRERSQNHSNAKGGRLLATSLCLLTLQVYYRYPVPGRW